LAGFDSHALRPGSTPLNSGPEDESNLVHRFDNDQPESYVDPVTVVNHAKPEGEHVAREEAVADEESHEQ
jgi:hypothetical protein